MTPALMVSAIAILAAAAQSYGQEGFSLDRSGGRLVITDEEHWSQWTFPERTLDVLSEGGGAVRPHFWRKDVNVATEAEIVRNLRLHPPGYLAQKEPDDFTLLDAVVAGTDSRDVGNLFDPDDETYWEPEFPQDRIHGLSQWWFTLDLGKIVLAEKIVLRFAEEGKGDPFLLFDVFVSEGTKPASKQFGEALAYHRVFQTLQPNLSERVFEIDAFPSEGRVRERLTRFVQVAVRGSSFERGREVSEAHYDSLRQFAPADTGMVEYVKKLSGGGAAAVSKEIWDQLSDDRRGPVRYWRRELPRLAAVEVWSEGDDIFQGLLERCLKPPCVTKTVEDPSVATLLDGDILTQQHFSLDTPAPWFPPTRESMFFDLGSFFWIDSYRHVIDSRKNIVNSHTFGEWGVDFSDGSLEADGSLKWERKFFDDTPPVRHGSTLLDQFDMEPVKARYMRLQWLVAPVTSQAAAWVAELQLFGEGSQPEVELTSDFMALGESRNLVSIEWDADTPAGTSVQLQTRTGNEVLTADTLYINAKTGEPFGRGPEAAEQYHSTGSRLSKLQCDECRIPIVEAGPDWSPLSEPLTESGSPVPSPSPRRYVQIRARLLSDDPYSHATLREVRLNFDEPVAGRLLGEVAPRQVRVLGEEFPYTLFVELEDLEGGFDELLVRPPAGMEVGYSQLYSGSLSQLADGEDMSELVLEGVELSAQGDSLHLQFPAVEPSSTVEALRLEFTGTLFSQGGRVEALLRRSDRGKGSWQRVDAREERVSLTLVAAPESRELFRDVRVEPAVVTPNGDGVNEEATVSFTLLLAGGDTPVEVEIFDLSGRFIRRLEERREVSAGAYEIGWDGRDEAGQLVPPGVYGLRASPGPSTDDTDLTGTQILRTVAVAY